MDDGPGRESHDKRDEIARGYLDREGNEKASELFRTNLAWSKSNLGSNHPMTLSDQESLAFSLHELGRYQEAATLDEKTLHVRRKEHVGDEAEILETQHNLALNFFKLGRYQEAAALDRKTLQERRVALGKRDLDTLSSQHNLAASLHELRQYGEAAQLNDSVVKARKSLCGAKDPDLISSRHNLASNLNSLERYKEAASLLEENLNVLRSARNKADPQLLISEELFERNDSAWSRQKLLEEKARQADRAAKAAATTKKSSESPRLQFERNSKEAAEDSKASQSKTNNINVKDKQPLPEKPLNRNHCTSDSTALGNSPQKQPYPNLETAAKGASTSHDNVVNGKKVTHGSPKYKQDSILGIGYQALSPHSAAQGPRARSKSDQDLTQSSSKKGDLGVSKELPQRAASIGPATGASHKPNEPRRRKSMEVPAADRKPNALSKFFDAHTSDQNPYVLDAADSWFGLLESDTQALLEPYRRNNVKRVKIAILDTGLDRTHATIKAQWSSRVKDVKSWVNGETAEVDHSGHGTHAAALLMRIAPEAHIYVARVAKDSGSLNAEVVTKAIMHASDEWKVDIISMSFGFPRWYSNIERAIGHAVRQNAVVFAAASNDGANRKIAFPASLTSGVIRINSADGGGARSRYNPSALARDYNFSVLGEAVSSAWPTKPGKAVERRQWGTSTSTPIAAAIAALILEFERQLKKQKPELKIHHRERLKSLEGMKEIFSHMSEEKDGYSYIVPWKLLDKGRGRDHVAFRLSEIMYNKFGFDDEGRQ